MRGPMAAESCDADTHGVPPARCGQAAEKDTTLQGCAGAKVRRCRGAGLPAEPRIARSACPPKLVAQGPACPAERGARRRRSAAARQTADRLEVAARLGISRR